MPIPTSNATTQPTVSVIVPVFNGARYLRATLDSVFAQDYPSVEIIVVDDASTDATPDILAAEPRARVLRQSANRGVSAARNSGLEAARGAFVAFLDGDDLWHPKKLSRQAAYLQARPQFGFCITKFKNFLDPDLEQPHWLPPHMFTVALPGLIPSAVLLTRDTVDRAGRFNETMRRGEDLDYFSRINDLGIGYGMLDETLVERRIHDGNLTRDLEKSISGILQAVRQSILRKRAVAAPRAAS